MSRINRILRRRCCRRNRISRLGIGLNTSNMNFFKFSSRTYIWKLYAALPRSDQTILLFTRFLSVSFLPYSHLTVSFSWSFSWWKEVPVKTYFYNSTKRNAKLFYHNRNHPYAYVQRTITKIVYNCYWFYGGLNQEG